MADELRCRWCGRRFPPSSGPGRPREFCRRSCRQRDYEARRRSTDLGLSESELVVTRTELDELGDLLFVLEAAVEDVERDLRGNPTESDYVEAIEWLLAAARPVIERGIRNPQ